MNVYPSPDAVARLKRAAEETGRTVEDLATSAIEEVARDWARARNFPGEDHVPATAYRHA